MKKIILFIFLSFSLLSFSNKVYLPDQNLVTINESDVYICVSPTAYVYHSTLRCWGLNKCTHDISKVSLDEAKGKYGRRACQICY